MGPCSLIGAQLIEASKRQKVKLMKRLLNAGAPVNIVDHQVSNVALEGTDEL